MLIIGASSVLSFVMSFTGLPQAISSLLLGVTNNKILLLLIINLILLIMGTLMDMAPALLIITLIFMPIATSLGMDPVQFGVMMVMNLAIGTITPPVGNVLFVGCSVADLKVEDVMKRLLVILLLLVKLPLQMKVEIHKIFSLLFRQMIHPVIFMEEAHEMQLGELALHLFHLLSADVENNAVVALVLLGRGLGHTDQIRIHEDQISFSGDELLLLKKN